MLRATPRIAFALLSAVLITTTLFITSRSSQSTSFLPLSPNSLDDFTEPKDEESLRAGAKAPYPYQRPTQLPLWNPPKLPTNSTTFSKPASERFLLLVKPGPQTDTEDGPSQEERETLEKWLETTLPTWRTKVIELDPAFSALHAGARRVDKGRIADAYLRYIIEHYNDLPSIVAFLATSPSSSSSPSVSSSLPIDESSTVHPPTQSGDSSNPSPASTSSPLSLQDRSRITALRNLDTDYLMGNHLTPLTCMPCATLHTSNPPAILRTLESRLPKVWANLFDPSSPCLTANSQEPCASPPDQISTPLVNLGAESEQVSFAVTRTQIRTRSVKEYLQYWFWLNQTIMDDDSAGEMFAWLFHVIFGMESVWCPFGGEQEEGDMDVGSRRCECEVYGRCG